MPQHTLSALDLDADRLLQLFERALWYKQNFAERDKKLLGGCVFDWVFYAPSTRTRHSFEMAAKHLGGNGFSTENAREFSSASKGESLFRTLHNLIGCHPHAIIVRHDHGGELQEAVARLTKLDERLRMPVFNGGDGGNQHPTQAFLDMFTIWEMLRSDRLPSDKPLDIVFYGDNAASRTVNSLCLLLAKHARSFGIRLGQITFVGMLEGSLPRKDVSDVLPFRVISCGDDHDDVASYQHLTELFRTQADVVYVTRWQNNLRKEGEPERVLVLQPEYVEMTPAHFKILHPQPINSEIDEGFDYHPKAAYREQSENGLYIRMAMLDLWVPRNVW